MTTAIKVLPGSAWLAAAALIIATALSMPRAQAQFCCSGPPPNDVSDYAVLYTGDPHTLFWSDSSTNSNIGIGDTGSFSGSGSGTITGQVRFAAPAGTGSVFSPDGITVTGGSVFGVATVATNLNSLNALSQSLRNEGGTSLLVAAAASINASAGILDSNGNRVFTGTIAPSFIAGTTFTINGTSDQFVVVNTTTGGLPFNGSIVLTGGITSDHVLFNFDAGNFDTLSGGDPLVIDTAGNMTTGTFLDPNGSLEISDSVISGRIFGGDTSDSSVSGSTITAPPPFPVPAPPVGEPISAGLLGAGVIALRIIRRRQRPLVRS